MAHDLTTLYKVYMVGGSALGIASIDTPEVDHITETLSGSGIMGEIDMPTLLVKSMTVKLVFTNKLSGWVKLQAPGVHHLDCRLDIQSTDKTDDSYKHIAERITMRVMKKKSGFGKIEQGKKQDSESEFEVLYIKHVVDGKETLEIDKLNEKYVVDGTDHMAVVRQNTGMEG